MTSDIDYFAEIAKHAGKGNTLEVTAKILNIHYRTVQRICKTHNTTYSSLKPRKKLKLKGDKDDTRNSRGKNHSSSNTQKKNSGETEIIFDMSNKKIDEDFYQEYLKSVIECSPPNIKILTEVRNYLDKKQALRPASQNMLEMSPEQVQALSIGLEEIH